MAVDETLLEAAANLGQCTLRFYQWAKPTLSLGYFQPYAERAGHEASRQSAIVRRTSGGGAIMHDFDVTYSLAVPERHPLAADRLRAYRVVHQTLIEVLAGFAIEATLFAAGDNRLGCGETSAPSPAAQKEPFLCFQRRASGDVLVGNAKIAGSAQRRSRGAVLQHGSILLARSHAAPELDGLKELTGKSLSADTLIEVWSAKIAKALALSWQEGRLDENARQRATDLVAEKYASPSWTEHRGRGSES
jgi:lipoate-protein ligase A